MSALLSAGGRLARRVASATKTSFAVVGLVTSVGALSVVWQTKKFVEEESRKDRKRVLVLPFDRLKLVHRHDRLSWLQSTTASDYVEKIEVQELVDVIHEAATDPNIVAIYGQFGHGMDFSGGTADAEEIRNALRVFRESHRVHEEPNLSYDTTTTPTTTAATSAPRPLYAYADSFESPTQPENPNYYIASMFTHVHLQRQGVLNLFGFSSSVPFLRKTMEKYGVKVHVYKHGPFKNAPNSWTETGFTGPHRHNVETYLFALNNYWCQDIANAREPNGLPQLSNDTWNLIQNSGSFTALRAQQIGFVDYICDKSPLDALLAFRKATAALRDDGSTKTTTTAKNDDNTEKQQTETAVVAETIKTKWASQTDLEGFPADEAVTLSDYRTLVSKRRKLEHYQWRTFSNLKDTAAKHSLVKNILALAGYKDPYFNLSESDFCARKARALTEKIALLKIHGTIDGKKVRELSSSLERIKKDDNVKCVVVRVSSPGGTIEASETLLQELKHLPQPVVFSFGNVSASGGYYIASFADHIFASKSTLTGSIGVFGVRLDLKDAAAQYGVKFGHIATSDFALSNSPFFPCTKQIHANSARSVDRAYQRFKEVVKTGRRGLQEQEDYYVETIAGGRVWTGEQAHRNGLVDEIGGLNRAIAYARRNYTSGDARVERYTDDNAYFERVRRLLARAVSGVATTTTTQNDDDDSNLRTPLSHDLGGLMTFSNILPKRAFGLFLTVDENTAIRSLMMNDSGPNNN